jgi:hypothetical protein
MAGVERDVQLTSYDDIVGGKDLKKIDAPDSEIFV